MNSEINLTLNNENSDNFEINSSEMFKSILEVAPFAFNLWNKDLHNVMCNAHILNAFNIERQEDFLNDFFKYSPPLQPNGVPSGEMARIHFDNVKKNGKDVFNWLHNTSDGVELPCEITLIKLDTSFNEEYIVSFIKDLRSNLSYGKANNHYDYYFTDKLPRNVLMEEMTELSDEWFFSVDLRTGKFYYYSKMWFNSSNENSVVTEDEMLKLGLFHEDDIVFYRDEMEKVRTSGFSSFEIRLKNLEGNYRYHKITSKLVRDRYNTPVFIVGKGIDIHEQHVFEERSQKDLLTDCYNKISAENIVSEKLVSNSNSIHTFFIIDIDNFKSINDNFGHFFGDEVLRDISTGLKTAFRDIDIVARIGGDEFIIFVENLSDVDIITQKAEKILEVYRKSYSGEYKDYSISGSVGIALFPRDGTTYDELYQNADKALNQAKIQGKNRFMVYTDDLNIGTTRSITKIENANRMASSYFDYDLISAVFNILYEKNGDSDSINLTLSYLCQKYGADRSYIFETLDGGITLNNTFEYCNAGISSEIDNLQDLPYELFADFLSKAHNDIIYSNNLRETLELDKAFEIMDDQGILSFVHAQIKRDGQMTFFIGLDDCTKTRIWTEREINSLQYIGKLLSIILQGAHLRDKINTLAINSKNSAEILDNSDHIVYVSDLNSYDLLYVNEAGRVAMGAATRDELIGRKCYETIQGKDKPCDFCTNHLLVENEYYVWSYYNPMIDKTFLLKDKLMCYNGSAARVEIATDISEITTLEKTLTDKLADEHFLMNCVEMLHSGNEPDISIYSLLKAVTNYYDAERSYIFEVSDCGNYISNTYEYCKEGHVPYKDKLQDLPADELRVLLNKCESHEAFHLNVNELDKSSLEYELMELQKLEDITIGAIRVEGRALTGFVGVDNSNNNKKKTSIIRTVAKFTATFLDETEYFAKLNMLSYYDTLTGLKNRNSYSLTLKEIDNRIDTLGVLYVDIMQLSTINDAKGIVFGDSILVRLANILQEIFEDKVYRVGGDEFVVITVDVEETDFENSITLLKEKLNVESEFNTTIGYTWNKNFKSTNGKLKELHEGENYARILRDNLEREISSGKYVVYMQPQVDFMTSKVEGAEALVRRIGANGVLQPPGFFLPFYEKEGIISKIDEFVFKTVCKTMKSWKDDGAQNLPTISVNCSRLTISEKGIVENFSMICDNYGVDRSKIVIEITETINGIGENILSGIIKDFSEAGFLVSLDDFGSGYSNLNSLVVSDFDEIKIDMMLVGGIHNNKKSKVLTQLAINLCNSLDDLISVAEGVENRSQHDILRDMGCRIGQGYYFAKPMSIDEFTAEYVGALQ